MIQKKFYGTINKNEKGTFYLIHDDPQGFSSFLEQWPVGKEMEYTVKPKYKKRTSGQPDEETNFNGYYWGVCVRIIADEIGEVNTKLVHSWIQENVGNVKGMPDGKVVPAGTEDMSGGDFAEYCKRVRIWASTPGTVCENGLYIPEPHEADWDK